MLLNKPQQSVDLHAVLSEELIVQIRHDPRHYTVIAADLNMHPETIRMAKTNTTGKHVDATE